MKRDWVTIALNVFASGVMALFLLSILFVGHSALIKQLWPTNTLAIAPPPPPPRPPAYERYKVASCEEVQAQIGGECKNGILFLPAHDIYLFTAPHFFTVRTPEQKP